MTRLRPRSLPSEPSSTRSRPRAMVRAGSAAPGPGGRRASTATARLSGSTGAALHARRRDDRQARPEFVDGEPHLVDACASSGVWLRRPHDDRFRSVVTIVFAVHETVTDADEPGLLPLLPLPTTCWRSTPPRDRQKTARQLDDVRSDAPPGPSTSRRSATKRAESCS